MKLSTSKNTNHIGTLFFVALLSTAFGGTGCSIQKFAVNATGDIIDNTITVLYQKSDIEFAKNALPENLLLVEGLIKSNPDNTALLLQAVMGYTGYALGFVEDTDPERAPAYYATARDYGFRLLSRNSSLKNTLDGRLENFETALQKTNKKDVPALFWAANAWGSYIKSNPGDMEALSNIGKVQALMMRVVELDETYYYGSAHLFLGIIEMVKGIAGNREAAKNHFEKALKIADGKFLLTQALYARYYAVGTDDEKLFTETLQKVLDTSGEVCPEFRLINEIAKKKAQWYLDHKSDWFGNKATVTLPGGMDW